MGVGAARGESTDSDELASVCSAMGTTGGGGAVRSSGCAGMEDGFSEAAAERTGGVAEAAALLPVKTITQHRARLNVIPDSASLQGLIENALTALSRGVRWARGSILNLLV